MQRKISIFCLALFMFCFVAQSHAQKGKSEFALGYGYWSIYTFANGTPFNTSSGTTTLTYRYYLSKDISLGLGLGYENVSNWASFVTVCPEITVKYLDTRDDRVRVRLYGSASYGISVLGDNVIKPGDADESGVKPYAFQLTPIGVRFGRQLGYFVELGMGYKGLLSAGASFRFPRVLPIHKHVEEDEDQNADVNKEAEENSKHKE